MIAGTPDIKILFETLDECVECKFNDKFSRYADYLSIAKIEDTQIISGKPVSKNKVYQLRDGRGDDPLHAGRKRSHRIQHALHGRDHGQR